MSIFLPPVCPSGDDVIKDGDKEAVQKPDEKQDVKEEEKELQGKEEKSKGIWIVTSKKQSLEPAVMHVESTRDQNKNSLPGSEVNNLESPRSNKHKK